jgi:hypothetical protein
MDTNILKDIFTSPFGSIGFVLGIIVAIVWVVYYVTKYATKISTNHEILEKNINKIEGNIDEIRRDLSYVKGAIDLSLGIKDLLTQKKSPVSLTEMGEQIRQENNFDDIIAANWDKISKVLLSEKFKNPYDTQEFCINTAFVEPEKFFTEENINALKTLAFKKGLTFMSISRVLGVLIRDAYFSYKGINIDDVDKFDPNQLNNL